MSKEIVKIKAKEASGLKQFTVLLAVNESATSTALENAIKCEDFEVVTAVDAMKAISLLNTLKFSMIFCDLSIPGMKGLEVFILAQKLQPQAVRVALLGEGDFEIVIEAINRGYVNQFIAKPWEECKLKQMLSGTFERYRLDMDNQRMQRLIAMQHQLVQKNHEILKSQLKLGAKIHETLFAGKVPENISEFKIEVLSIPSEEIDGDFYEFFRSSSNLLDIVFADVMGKGIPAALVGSAVKNQLMRFALPFKHSQVYTHGGCWEEDLLKPDQILSLVHREVVPQLIKLNYFVSLYYARFDLLKHTFTYVDCGSAKPLRLKAKDKTIEILEGCHFPLGAVEKEEYVSKEVSYAAGDVFVFYSDGVIEARSPKGELFGVERLIGFIKEQTCDPKELVEGIKNEVMKFTRRDRFEDDFSIVVLEAVHFAQRKHDRVQKAVYSADLSQLVQVRNFVKTLCCRVPGNKEILCSQLQLAINEVFCNIVKHGYKSSGQGCVIIEGSFSDKGIAFQVSDKAASFDPSQVANANLTGKRTDGFGWHIIRSIVDKMWYIPKEFEGGWNHLCIYKKFLQNEGQMELMHNIQNDILVISPKDVNLDAQNAHKFKEKVNEMIALSAIHHVILDMHNLQFIDSSGLGALLSILKVLHTSKGELKLTDLSNSIRTMFELVSLHKIFEVYNSTDDAVRSFEKA